jgi:diadenosine tetraphosphate (Ap4A) HIT family hydrolase
MNVYKQVYICICVYVAEGIHCSRNLHSLIPVASVSIYMILNMYQYLYVWIIIVYRQKIYRLYDNLDRQHNKYFKIN